ncbi:efflux RND transporter periplasmic adaptor subunit [Trichlorobacter lovleyi]|uniref:Efflux transporter, RND family, MFP subunit n=1 Tax=Trichlorobacter lovleyi (strain ATCC BAA-1151 / DSM 17278 / SZ) TaxID=398767 RepID=B3E353_TRIL1|nr:efflux RND transporter periplasmic adaptor subunit [Trichlorobacter lovleyi]ACD94265.1 efflux transporter, RND family, MFP subunit [Trichlorobacter lovleyi SZ]QOX77760.1 efflux RND transporter periplasmic adaptor subunit [Trichlorobacter lovleyi]
MKKRTLLVSLLLLAAIGSGLYYRITTQGDAEKAEPKEAGSKDTKAEKHEEDGKVKMTAELQQQNGVAVGTAATQRLAGVISATGKVDVNSDRIAHVSPRISGKIVSVRSSLGDQVSAGQVLVTLDSVELGEALNRYHQSKTKLALAQSSMDRIKLLVDKKIAARKDILLAETEFKTAQTELHTDEERLALYGVSLADLTNTRHRSPLLPVRSPISGIITEKHAIVGELADPSKNLFTIADLSSVWIMVDINEKDLAKIHRGQIASVSVSAFPDLKLQGRITYIADLVDQNTRTVKARIEVANLQRKLKPEMFASVELKLAADAPPVLAVPEESLQDLDGKKVVFVVEGKDTFVPRPVQAGRMANGKIEILSGLQEGELYAVKGAFILKSELKKAEMKDEH